MQTAYRILLADDDEDDRLFFKEAVDELSVKTELSVVNNGVDLMKYLEKKDVPLPFLTFIDINMPGKNGMKALQEIRTDARLKPIHVIMYSTSSTPKDIEQAFTNGANGYIVKPPDFDTLKRTIEKTLEIDWDGEKRSIQNKNFVIVA